MSTNARARSKSTGLEQTKQIDGVDADELYALLSNSRRRAIVRIMLEHERLDFSELVDKVTEMEYGLPIEQISSDERHTIYVSVAQSHSDRLEQSDIIKRERDTGTVSLGHNADVLARWLPEQDRQGSLGSKLKQMFGR